MRKSWIIVVFILLMALPQVALAKEVSFSYDLLNKSIVRLEFGIYSSSSSGSNAYNIKYHHKQSAGTGFFVSKGRKTFIVTARHVAELNVDLHARVILKNEETNKDETYILNLPKDNWTFHPNKGDETTHYVDVAAMKLGMFDDKHLMYGYAYDTNNGKHVGLKSIDPTPPEEILVYGFPADIGFELSEQKPMVRSGIISLQSGKLFLKLSADNKYFEEKCLLIDSRIFGGNSGGPVTDKSDNLVGLVIGSNEYYSFAIIEPVSRIKETVEIADNIPIKPFLFWLPNEFKLSQ